MISPAADAAAPANGDRRGPTRVVFLGTPDFAIPSLRALLDSPRTEVALVVTQPDRPAGRGRRLTPPPTKALAEGRGVPIFQPERLRGPEAIDRLRAANADLFVIAAYGQLLRQAILDIPRHGCLNVHPSLLPRHRGPAPIAGAILAGDAETGVTIMLTDRGMDTGPILTQEPVPLGPHETTASLTPRLADLGADLLLRTIPRWVDGAIEPRPQDDALATVTRTFTKADGGLDWSRPALDLERQIRALNPWPRAYTFARGRRLIILNARAAEGDEGHQETNAASPGTILATAGAEGPLVATGEGLLRLLEVQPEGRRPLTGAELLRQDPGLVGTLLTAGVEPPS